MKSLTIAIRNREQRVIGLLCINMNLDVPFSQIMSTFVPPETPDVGSSVNFASSVEDLVTQTLEFTIEEVNADPPAMPSRRRPPVLRSLRHTAQTNAVTGYGCKLRSNAKASAHAPAVHHPLRSVLLPPPQALLR